MAQYYTDFSAHDEDTLPSDITIPFTTTEPPVVKTVAGAIGGKALQWPGGGANNERLAQISGVSFADGQVYARFKCSDFDNGEIRLAMRTSGNNSDRNGYFMHLNFAVNSWGIFRLVSSASTAILTSITVPITLANDTWINLLYDLDGSSHRGKIWLGDPGDIPGSYQLTATDGTISAAGEPGFGRWEANGTIDLDTFSFGTDGVAAPLSAILAGLGRISVGVGVGL